MRRYRGFGVAEDDETEETLRQPWNGLASGCSGKGMEAGPNYFGAMTTANNRSRFNCNS